jgi:hypothetical protein
MRILAFIFPAIFIASCFSNPKPISVTVTSDEFIPGIIHDVTYRINGEIVDNPEVVFDSVAGIYRSIWDTCATGEYSVTLTTVFGTETVQTFNVNSDSILLVKNDLPFTSVGFISEDSMLKADTVQFVRVVSGCYQQDLHKVTLIKTFDGYEMSEYPTPAYSQDSRLITKEEGIALIQEFIQSEKDVEQLRVDRAGELFASTVRQYVFFRADSQVYSYYDDGARWVSYPEVYIP